MPHHAAKFCVGLSILPGIGPARFTKLVDRLGSAERAWSASAEELRDCGVEERALPELFRVRQSLDLDAELARIHSRGAKVLTWDDLTYPAALAETYMRPAILYLQGTIEPGDSQAIAVVGTRRPSLYGQTQVAKLVPLLVQKGLTIVSGLAVGVDTIAHRLALESGGRTIAVLGSGLDVLYPSQNRGLAERIAQRGAVVTEYAMGTKPDAFNFPARNRIISGLSLGTIVIEAGYKSGALITARFACEQNREVFAFPGRSSDVQSAGCNTLIRRGHAKLVADCEDILEELNLDVAMQQLEIRHVMAENETEARLLNILSSEPMHTDEVGRQAGLSAADVSSTLTMLELKGAIRQVGSMHYVLSR
jgi:DNA processing protein